MRSKRRGFVFAVVALVAVAALGWYHTKATDRAYLEGLLIGRVAEVGYVANSLELLEEGDADRLRALLETELTSSTQHAARLVGIGARVDAVAVPNLVEGLERARSYAVAHGITAMVPDIEIALAGLPPNPDRH